MAKYQIIVTRDIVANVHSMPMFVLHLGQSIRAFGDECQKQPQPGQNNPLWDHPEHYELIHIGEYDDESAELTVWNADAHAFNYKQLASGANYARGGIVHKPQAVPRLHEDRTTGGREN